MVGSNVDWLTTHKQYDIKELFVRIVAQPEAGPNSMRSEILLTAFTEAVITVGENDHLILVGDVPKNAEIWKVMTHQISVKRQVAFRLN